MKSLRTWLSLKGVDSIGFWMLNGTPFPFYGRVKWFDMEFVVLMFFLHRWPIDSISVTVVVKKYEKWICRDFRERIGLRFQLRAKFSQQANSVFLINMPHLSRRPNRYKIEREPLVVFFPILGEQRQNKGRWGVTAARNVHPAFSDEREVPGKFSQLLAPLSACKAGICEWKCVCAHPLQPFRARRGRRNGHNKKHIAHTHTTTLVRANEPRPTITHSDDKL